jgi:carbamoyl-phosphate synthase large subunit
VFVSVADRDKRAMVFPARRLADLRFKVLATGGTADVLRTASATASVASRARRATRQCST